MDLVSWNNGATPWNFSTTVTANMTLTAQWQEPATPPPAVTPVNTTSTAGTNIIEKAFNYANATAGDYLVVVGSNISVNAPVYDTSGELWILISGCVIDDIASSITIIGAGSNKTISLTGNGHLFQINNANAKLTLDCNITLQGHDSNNSQLINMYAGELVMNDGATITGNKGGGVLITYGMGTGKFTMNGGTISNNSAENGGGVYVEYGTFTMNSGTISGNTASNNGGGVRVSSGTFTMNGGTISGNSAHFGGGVMVSGSFTKTGGTIYGSDETTVALKNTTTGGAAIDYMDTFSSFPYTSYKRYTTAGPSVNLDSSTAANWE